MMLKPICMTMKSKNYNPLNFHLQIKTIKMTKIKQKEKFKMMIIEANTVKLINLFIP